MFAKIGKILREGGVLALIKIISDRILHRLFRFRLGLVNRILLKQNSLSKDSLDESQYHFCELTTEDILKFAREPENRFYNIIVDEAIAKGDRCFAILRGKELVTYNWYSSKPTLAFDGYVSFDSSYIYSFHSYTLPRFRRLGLSKLLLNLARSILATEGYLGTYAIVEWSNYPSIRHASLGHGHIVGKMYQFKFRRKLRTHCSKSLQELNFRYEPLNKSVRDTDSFIT